MNKKIADLRMEMNKVIKGKDDIIVKIIMTVLASGHILLEDNPGLGKTTLAKTFSKATSMQDNRIQFTPDTMPSDILGYSMYNQREGKMEFVKGPVFTNLLLADEINRTSSKTQAALREAMAEATATVDNVTYQLPKPFITIATQNPITSGGTQALPDSQLDRFMVRLSMGYPDVQSQVEMLMEDVMYVIYDIFKHRLILTPSARREKNGAENIIYDICQTTEAPSMAGERSN